MRKKIQVTVNTARNHSNFLSHYSRGMDTSTLIQNLTDHLDSLAKSILLRPFQKICSRKQLELCTHSVPESSVLTSRPPAAKRVWSRPIIFLPDQFPFMGLFFSAVNSRRRSIKNCLCTNGLLTLPVGLHRYRPVL